MLPYSAGPQRVTIDASATYDPPPSNKGQESPKPFVRAATPTSRLTNVADSPENKRITVQRSNSNPPLLRNNEAEEETILDDINTVDLLLSAINRLSVAAVNVSEISRIVERLRGAAAVIGTTNQTTKKYSLLKKILLHSSNYIFVQVRDFFVGFHDTSSHPC